MRTMTYLNIFQSNILTVLNEQQKHVLEQDEYSI